MAEIRCLVLDVDGVLTDGRLLYGGCTEPLRSFHVHDGLAIMWFQRLGGTVALLTGKTSLAVENRSAELGIRHVVQGSRNKSADLRRLLHKLEILPAETAMLGDDLPDLGAMSTCAYPMAVADAAPPLRRIAKYVTERLGGHGAVREAIEHLMRSAGQWDQVVAHYAGEDGAEHAAAQG